MFFLFCCLDIYVFSLLDDSDSPASAIFSQEKGQQDEGESTRLQVKMVLLNFFLCNLILPSHVAPGNLIFSVERG